MCYQFPRTKTLEPPRLTDHKTPQNPHGYATPSQPTTSAGDYINRNAQYPQDPQQSMGQVQGYNSHGNVTAAQNIPQSSAEAKPQSATYFASHQNPPVDATGGGIPQGHLGPGASTNIGVQYQQHGGPMPPHVAPGAPPQDPSITVIESDPNRPLFPIPYQEAQRQRERQYQSGQPQPQHDSRYQYSSERPPPAGYEPRAAQGGYYDRIPQAHDPRYQQQHQHQKPPPGGGFNPGQARYDTYQDPRYEYRGGEYPSYDGQSSSDQHGRYPMHRQPSQGNVPQHQYDYGRGAPHPGFQAGAPGYAAAHDQRYSGGPYPGGRSR